MTTLFLSVQGLSPMHQATETELINERLAQGHRVVLLQCDACLLTCSLNNTHNLLGCAVCQQRSRARLPAAVSCRTLDRSLFPNHAPVALPATVDALMELTYEDINIGRGVVSSSISILRDYALDPRGKHRELIELEICNAIGALLNYRAVLTEVAPTEVVLFNGRHAELWPMLELCKRLDIVFVCHERGGSVNHYQEFRNSLPHSIAYRKQLLREVWNATDPGVRTEAAEGWFQSKRKGSTPDDRSYLDGMTQGQLPAGFDRKKHNIVVFNSSEDEMQAIAEWQTDLFRHQNDVIRALAGDLGSRPDVHLYVRMHPNLAVVDNQQTRELYALRQDNLTVLPPRHPVDSYTLCEAADVILTFASTIGVEATYWRTPSVLYGRAFYEGEDAVYEPQSYPELLALLTTPGLPPKPRENALRYGYFVSHFGIPYRHARVVDPRTVYLADGSQVKRFTWGALGNLLRYLPQVPAWLRTHRIVTGSRLRLTQLTRLYSHLREKA